VLVSIDICVQFGMRVRELRRKKGWTQFEMAERSGLDRSYLAEIETAKIEVCLRNLETIANTFEVTPSELLKPPKRKR
jgi:transcriptional regulator with XRE-family HTH domain